MHEQDERRTALIIGATRGLGHAITAELHGRGWAVVGTARDPEAPTPLHELAARSDGDVEVERLDVTDPAAITALRTRLDGRRIDLLLVSAGTTAQQNAPVGTVPTEDFVQVMLTNALSPMRAVESMQDLVPDGGVIAAMSSGQGSITNAGVGGRELYRGSKAALNMFMRTFAARDAGRAVVLMAPGWIRTDLGGDQAPFTMEEAVPQVVDVLLSRAGTEGIAYLDRFGATVPW